MQAGAPGMAETGADHRVGVVANHAPRLRQGQWRFKIAIAQHVRTVVCGATLHQNQIIEIQIAGAFQKNEKVRRLLTGGGGALDRAGEDDREPTAIGAAHNVRSDTIDSRTVAGEPIARPAMVLGWIDKLDRGGSWDAVAGAW